MPKIVKICFIFAKVIRGRLLGLGLNMSDVVFYLVVALTLLAPIAVASDGGMCIWVSVVRIIVVRCMSSCLL